MIPKIFTDDIESLEQAIHTAGGAFSMCWKDVEKAGEFQSSEARQIANQLVEWIDEHTTVVNPSRSKGEKIVAECLQNGEPFFVFRGQDIFTIMIIRNYMEILEKYGPYNPEMQENIQNFIDKVLRPWQEQRVTEVGYPD